MNLKKIKLVENLTDKQLLKIEAKLKKRSKLKLVKDFSLGPITTDHFYNMSDYNVLNHILLYVKHCTTIYEKSEKIQCCPGCNRSQGDLYNIMRYYRPNITFKKFRSCLIRLLNNRQVNTLYCANIHKRVFFKNKSSIEPDPNFTRMYNLSTIDEYDHTLDKFSDGTTRPSVWNTPGKGIYTDY
jgi:hypothetical protein